jgi:hypothetical protein
MPAIKKHYYFFSFNYFGEKIISSAIVFLLVFNLIQSGLLSNGNIYISLSGVKNIYSDISLIDKAINTVNAAIADKFVKTSGARLKAGETHKKGQDVFIDENILPASMQIKKQNINNASYFPINNLVPDKNYVHNMSPPIKDSGGGAVFYFLLMLLFFVSVKNHIWISFFTMRRLYI